MSPATKLLDVKYTQPPGREPTSGNGVPVRLLMPPEEPLTSDGATRQEPLRFHDRWAAIEQFGSQAGTFGQAMVFRLAEFITVCATSPMWRTMSIAVTHALTCGLGLFFKTEQVVVETLTAIPWGEVWRIGKKSLKLAICVYMDFLDFLVGRVLGLGIFFDIGCACMCAALWGKRGWWALWEVVDVTENLVDAWVPTCTMIALRCWKDE
jgi:hypothetical protein